MFCKFISLALATALITVAKAAPATQQQDTTDDDSSGAYAFPCVTTCNDTCLEGTSNHEVFALADFNTIERYVKQYNQTNESDDTLKKIIQYTILSFGGRPYNDQSEVNSGAACTAKDLIANAEIQADCSELQGHEKDVCTASQQSDCAPSAAPKQQNQPTMSDLSGSFSISCDTSHAPPPSDCQHLIADIQSRTGDIPLSPRNIEYLRCYTSWSAQVESGCPRHNLYNAAQAMYEQCGVSYQSAKASNTHLCSTTVTQCLSDRPDGCH